MTSVSNPPLEMVDDLDCSIVGPSTDDDGDSVTYTYTWYDPNGVDVQVNPGVTSFRYLSRFCYDSRFVGVCH